ncbi:hypothetical protein LCL61_14505 [Amycolatopsis coloradensis]|uniref:Uncharacterized protein n=1 Tax=Amycolatopsis coloradensis TaxID=76021 RepID=A0ACD5BBI7_9PSEU
MGISRGIDPLDPDAAAGPLLFLEVDLGPVPTLEDYQRNVTALLILAGHASLLPPVGSRWLDPSARVLPRSPGIVRTTMASPWVSVLSGLAERSAPVAYGAAALYGLHRLLEMVMTWQRHRLEIEEGEVRLEQLRGQLRDTGVQLRQEFDPRLVAPGEDRGEPGRQDELAERAANPPAEVVRAADQIGTIIGAEMIDPGDPRAG